jgi:hypothetical protein
VTELSSFGIMADIERLQELQQLAKSVLPLDIDTSQGESECIAALHAMPLEGISTDTDRSSLQQGLAVAHCQLSHYAQVWARCCVAI